MMRADRVDVRAEDLQTLRAPAPGVELPLALELYRECRAYRELAQQAIHALHRLQREYQQLSDRYRTLRDERRHQRGAA